jgi:hypothetical protein
MDLRRSLTELSQGSLFVLLPLFYGSVLINALLTPKEQIQKKAVLIASAAVGVFYLHHAFSRADLPHLAQSIHPFLLGIMAIPGLITIEKSWRASLILYAVLGFVTVFGASPGNYYLQRMLSERPYRTYEIGGDELWLTQGQIQLVAAVQDTYENMIEPGNLFVTPYMPGIYALLSIESPVWDTYLIWPKTESDQLDMIRMLQHKEVNWALVADITLDGREELRFSHTHDLVWEYLQQEYEVIDTGPVLGSYMLYHRVDGD